MERLRREEEERIKSLENQIEAWYRSRQIREYLQAVKRTAIQKYGRIEPSSELDKWLTWAKQHADRVDPLVEVPLPVLSKEID